MMGKEQLYMKLDTIKLALESSATLLSKVQFHSDENKYTVSDGNIRSLNATIHVASKMLRDILHEEMEAADDDQEEDDQL